MKINRISKIFAICVAVILIFIFGYKVADLNGKKNSVYDDKTSQFVHNNPSTVLSNLNKKKPGVYYFGFPTCPWCIELLPVLDQELKAKNLTAEIVNTHGNLYTSHDNIQLEKIFLRTTNKDKLTVPFVVVVNRHHKVFTHVGTVKGHNAEIAEMTSAQHKKLKVELNTLLKNFYN